MKKNLFSIHDQVAIITGGAGVLGGAIAEGLARAGAKVGILSRTAEKVNKKVADLKSQGLEAMPLVCDVLNESQLEAARQNVLDAGDELTSYSMWPAAIYPVLRSARSKTFLICLSRILTLLWPSI